MSVHDWNRSITQEFRSNDGKVGGQFANIPILLLHTVGAKSGEPRLNPLAYQSLDGAYAIFGSFAGSPKHPAWYHNVVANPDVTIEVGTDKLPAKARVATGEERARIWEKQKVEVPGFADYEAKTGREIPVIVLEPIAA